MADPFTQAITFGGEITADAHNDAWDNLEAYLLDNLGSGAPGKMLVADATGKFVPVTISGDLSIDDDGVASVIPTFSGARVTKSGSQSISTATATALTWDTEDSDTGSYHSTVSNTERLVVPSTGYYVARAQVVFASAASGRRAIAILKNGAAGPYAGDERVGSSSAPLVLSCDTGPIHLSATDYLTVVAYQDSGSSLDVLFTIAGFGSTPDVRNLFSIQRVGV